MLALGTWWLFGDTWWNQLVNLSTFWWALPSLPLLALALVFRNWAAVLLLLAPAGLLVWAYGGPFLPSLPTSSAADTTEAELRVATYNVFIRAGGVSHVADLVADEQVDVLLVQELTGDRVDELSERLDGRLPHRWFGEADVSGGVGVLSRHPIEEVRPVPGAERFERATAVVVIGVPAGGGTQRVQVVPTHLVAACPLCGPFVQRQRYEVESRSREVSAVLAAIDPELPAVVGGDFNGTRRSDAYRTLARAGFRDPHAEVGFGLGFTYPAEHAPPGAERGRSTMAHLPLVWFPVLRLDHVLVRGLVPVDARVGASRASDHRPLIVDVALAD